MEVDYAREFVVLAETRNFMETADKLFISQSTLSRHIKTLEMELGASLFDRSTRKVELSRYGRLFLPYAKEYARIQYECSTAFYNELREVNGSVTVGSIPAMAQYKITNILAQFQKENTSFTLNIVEADSLKLFDMLRSLECDFAFIRESDDSSNEFNKLPFTTDSMVAILPLGHPLSSVSSLKIDSLRNEPLLLLGKDTFMYSLCMNVCRAAGFEPKVTFTAHRAENIIDLVSKGMGTALLMKKGAVYFANPKTVIVDIEPRISTAISLAYRKDKNMSLAATHFLNLVKTI